MRGNREENEMTAERIQQTIVAAVFAAILFIGAVSFVDWSPKYTLIDFAAIIKVLLAAAAGNALVKLCGGELVGDAATLHLLHAAGELLHHLRAIARPARIAGVAFLRRTIAFFSAAAGCVLLI
jgi:hypothetical protein